MAYRYGPEWDRPQQGAPIARRFAVASTGRSGSTLLCRLLWDTGICGMPEEYLHPLQIPPLQQRWNAATFGEYVGALERNRTSSNGVFGTKVHWNQMGTMGPKHPQEVTEMLRDARWVRITRTDQVAQALSHHRAEATGWWTAESRDLEMTGNEEPPYVFESILRAYAAISVENAGWEGFFAQNNITPLDVTYEELLSDMEATMQRVLLYILGDLEPSAGETALPEVNTTKQTNPQLAQWRAQFAEDARRFATHARTQADMQRSANASA